MLIPAYEEARTVARVVRFAKGLPSVGEVLVVDDGSVDETAKQATKAGARVIVHEVNRGKTAAVRTAATHARYEDVFMLDADLTGLSVEEFQQGLRLYEDADMVVFDYGGQHWVVRFVIGMLPATSGVRLLHKQVLLEAPFSKRNPWEIEGVINRYVFRKGGVVRVVVAKNLFSPRKESKYGRLRGAWLNLRSITLILLSLGVLGVPQTLLDWWRFRKLRRQAMRR